MAKKKDKTIKKVDSLDIARAAIQKKYGNVLQTMGEKGALQIEAISSGCMGLDMALGRGGFVRSRLYEIYGPPSGGKCLKRGAYINSNKGLLPIESFSNGKNGATDMHLTLASDTGAPVKTSYFYEEEVNKVYNISNTLGLDIGATPEHKIMILNSSAEFEMRKLEDIKVGDISCVCRNNTVFPDDDAILNYNYVGNKHNNLHTVRLPEKITPELARLIGYIIANGSGDKIYISTNNRSIRTDIQEICYKYNININKLSSAGIGVGAKMFSDFISFICKSEKLPTARFKTVPEVILKSTKETQIQFLAGLIDCDSYLNDKNQLEYYTASEELVKTVQVMLLNLGIITTKSSKYLPEYEHNYWKLRFTSFGTELFLSLYNTLKYKDFVKKDNYRTNIDVIPYLKERLIKEVLLLRNIFKVNKAGTFWYDDKFYRFTIGHVTNQHTNRRVTYSYLDRVLKELSLLPQISEVKLLIDFCNKFYNNFYFFSEITSVQEEYGPLKVYDFHIPDTHLFLSNGFVSHNTTLTMSVIAQAQKKGIKCCFVDAEHSADPKLFEAMGVNIDELEVIEGFVGDDNLDALEMILKTGEIGVAVVDSVAALIPKAEAESEIGNDHMALLARLMSKACRKFVPIASETNTLILFINQVRTDLKAWGDNQITTGGNALDFYGTGRIKVTGGKHNSTRILDDLTKEVIGHNTTFEITKNKLAPPFRKAEVALIYGVGYDSNRELIKLADQLGIVEKTGAWYNYEGLKVQGELNLINAITENEELHSKLKEDVLISTGLKEIYESNS